MIRDDVIYGEIEGVKEGDIFEDRKALMRAKVQSGWVAGIATGGAAIALNEGYKDDIDNGDVIIYTGEGGRKPGSEASTKRDELWCLGGSNRKRNKLLFTTGN